MIKTLYLTYDGLLDQLGQSQIIPYILGINKIAKITIISFEKKTHSTLDIQNQADFLSLHGIKWVRLTFTDSLGILGKIYDAIKLLINIIIYSLIENSKIIHARGHPCAIFSFPVKILEKKLSLTLGVYGWMKELIRKLEFRFLFS